jgi:SAM-dependent methyltransferase
MGIRGLQLGYARRFAKYMYDEPSRRNKALRAIQIFQEHRKYLKECKVLEVGSSTGILTYYLADVFREVVGIDIDEEALDYARKHYTKSNIQYLSGDALVSNFPDNSFDAVVCHHTYEHVADSRKLVEEIWRIIKPGGLLYFGAPNRLMLKESHYDIYFLSWFPKGISSLVLKWTGKGDYYYETMLTYWGVKKLLKRFTGIFDYTLSCICEPQRYYSEDVMKDYPWMARLPKWAIRLLIHFAPDFVFLAVK